MKARVQHTVVRSNPCALDPPAKLSMDVLRLGLLCPYPGRSTEMTRMLCSARTAALNIPLSSLLPDGLHLPVQGSSKEQQ